MTWPEPSAKPSLSAPSLVVVDEASRVDDELMVAVTLMLATAPGARLNLQVRKMLLAQMHESHHIFRLITGDHNRLGAGCTGGTQ